MISLVNANQVAVKQLKFITKLEEIQRKRNQYYEEFKKTELRQKHEQIDETDFKMIIFYKAKYNLMQVNKSSFLRLLNLVKKKYKIYEIPKIKRRRVGRSVFEYLPELVNMKIFCYLDHISLLNFIDCCPQFEWIAMQPFYWHSFTIDFNGLMFNHKQLINLFKYININLTKVSLHSSLCLTNTQLEILLRLVPRLAILELGHILNFNKYTIDLIMKHLTNLKFINFTNNNIINKDLLRLTQLSYLHSIDVSGSSSLSNSGLFNFIDKITRLRYLNIGGYLNKIDCKTMELIIDRHSSTLEELYIYGELLNDDSFKNLNLCFKLKSLNIESSKVLRRPFLEYLHQLKQIEEIVLIKFTGIKASDFLWLFKTNKFKLLKKLNLQGSNICDDSMKELPYR